MGTVGVLELSSPAPVMVSAPIVKARAATTVSIIGHPLFGRGPCWLHKLREFKPHCDRCHCFLPVFALSVLANETRHGHHGHIRGRALPPWPLARARAAIHRGWRCGRSRVQGEQGASAQRRRKQESSATCPEAGEREPAAEVVLRRLRRRASGLRQARLDQRANNQKRVAKSCARRRNTNSNSFRESDSSAGGLRCPSQVRSCRLSMMMILLAGLGKSSRGRPPLSSVTTSVGSRPRRPDRDATLMLVA